MEYEVEAKVRPHSVRIAVVVSPKEYYACLSKLPPGVPPPPKPPGVRISWGDTPLEWVVRPPNWFERLLGITYETKIARAYKRTENWAAYLERSE